MKKNTQSQLYKTKPIYDHPIMVRAGKDVPLIGRVVVNAALSFIDQNYPGLNKSWGGHIISLMEVDELIRQLKIDTIPLLTDDDISMSFRTSFIGSPGPWD